ncbi:MAG: hypothetical protein ABIJ34_07930 [archaeon]
MNTNWVALFCLILLLSSCAKETPLPIPQATVQWADSASASSSYGGKFGENRDDNSPFAATGEPDVSECGDNPRAWAQKEEDDGEQWIELTYYDEVFVSKIKIYETSGVGAIRKIELKNPETKNYFTFWEGAYKTKLCPYVLDKSYSVKENNITINMTPVKTDTIRITLDTDTPGWNEIDAVELIGYSQRWWVYNNTLWTG